MTIHSLYSNQQNCQSFVFEIVIFFYLNQLTIQRNYLQFFEKFKPYSKHLSCFCLTEMAGNNYQEIKYESSGYWIRRS